MKNVVVQRIRTALQSYSLSITFLADQLNIKQSTLIGKLNGTRALDIDTLCMILTALPFLSAEWILLGKGEMENLPKKDKPDELNFSDTELKEMYINQGREIHRLKKRIAELEGEKKDRA